MTPLHRIFLSVLLFTASIASFAAFEYFKLFTSKEGYFAYGLLAFVLFSFGIFSQLKWTKPNRAKSFAYSLLISAGVALSYTAYLKLRAGRELPRLVNSGLHCESLLLPLLHYPLDQFTTLANRNLCTLGFLEKKLSTESETSAENLLFKMPALLADTSVLEETTLAILLSFLHEVHARDSKPQVAVTALEELKNSFDLVEGDLTLLESYKLRENWILASRLTIENSRIKKALEISTLGKILNSFFAELGPKLDRAKDPKLQAGPLPDGAGQITLLDIRGIKIKTRCKKLLNKWDLPTQLAGLKLEDTYPEAYRGILKNVTVKKSFLEKISL